MTSTVTARVFTEQPTLVGHRGMGKGVVDGHRENTVESFCAAVDAGLDWLEVDVQRTSDDSLVVAHDAALPDGSLLAELSTEGAVGRGAVSLEVLLDSLPASVGVVFDVKSSLVDARRSASSTTAALLAQACAQSLGERPALTLSFDPAALTHMREALPDMALGLLTWFRFPIGHAVAAAAHLDVQVLAVHAGSLWKNAATGRADVPALETVVESVHAADRQLLVWCPSVRRARALAAAGVDAMVVDDVSRHLRALHRARRRHGG
jgi:glycerophosphoryl diester phosphodiesterase